MIKKLTPVIVLTFFTIYNSNAQTAILPSGGNATGVEGTVSYSVGQVDYIYINQADGLPTSVNQGVQHPYSSTTLPVTITNFTAFKNGSKVSIEWQTLSETNSKLFIVEKSSNRDFIALSEVKAAGNSNSIKKYSCVDYQPIKGWNYYRLKQIDLNGKFVYTRTVAINFNNTRELALVYPNPTTENIMLTINTPIENNLNFILTNVDGKSIKTGKILQPNTTINLSTLPSATYILKVLNSNSEIRTFTIIKRK